MKHHKCWSTGFMSVLVATLTCACTDQKISEFQSECRKIATIGVIDGDGWTAYIDALKTSHAANEQREEYLKIWPLAGFPVRSDLSRMPLRRKFPEIPFRNDFVVFMGGKPIALVHSLTQVTESFGNTTEQHCIYNFPELYKLPQSSKG